MIKLIDDAKDWRKFWSVKLAFIGGALLTLAELGPGYLASAWAALPVEFQDAVPENIVKYMGLAFVFLSPVARAIKQEKLHVEKTD